jgi:hypothetical protein
MNMRLLYLLIALGLAAIGQAAVAQRELRTIEAPAGSGWTHAQSKLVLPASVAGLPRGKIGDATQEELDVVADYSDHSNGMIATVYVYRTGLPDAAIWFDRAVWAIQVTPVYALNGAALPAPSTFSASGSGKAIGLRQSIALTAPDLRSTAVAVAPIGKWMVKVRLSSKNLDAAALDSKLSEVLAALGWPAEAGTGREIAAVVDCAKPLKTKKAKIVPQDMGQMLMAAVSDVAMERDGRQPVYCREPGLPASFGVYRADGSENSYVLTLDDAGNAMSVSPALDLGSLLGGSGGKSWSMVRLDRNGTSVFPSFNRLPPPEQAVSVALGSTPTLSTTVSDKPK